MSASNSLGRQFLHRGVWMDNRAGFSNATAGERAAAVQEHLQKNPGMHWSSDEDWARGWATRHVELAPPDRVHAVISIEHPGAAHVEHDPDVLRQHGVGEYQAEPEVPLKGGPRVVRKISWFERDKSDPSDGSWREQSVR